MGAIGDEDAAAPHDALLGERIELFLQRLRVDHHSAAENNPRVFVQGTRGHQMQLEGVFPSYNGMSCVGAAGETHHDVRLGGEKIDDFALAFVAPLRTDYYYVHASDPIGSSLGVPA